MELEKLNKTQIVLLTLLVSFVTSIATGIVTVTLLDQAPPGVTHTISKIVEHTVEKVVPDKTQSATTVKTIVVKEDDMIADAVEKNTKTTVRLFAPLPADAPATSTPQFLGLGFVVSGNGMMVTDSALVSDDTDYTVTLADGSNATARTLSQDEEKGVALLQIKRVDGAKPLTSVSLGDAESVRLGQTVLSLVGRSTPEVAEGIVSSIERVTPEGEGELSYVSSIKTSITLAKSASGSALFNTDGNVVGMNMVREGKTTAVSSTLIAGAIRILEEKESSEEKKAN